MRTSFLGELLFTGVALTTACGGRVVLDGAGGASTTSGSTTSGGTGGTGGGLAPGQCRSKSDCQGPNECLQPGGFPGCDPCYVPMMTCTGDADCPAEGGTAAICILVPCTCSGAMSCVPGCTTDASCGAGETCGPTHRCAPETCATTTDCPVDFTCSAAACQRLACTGDAMCSGYCVDGLCFETLGTCVPLPG